MGFWNENKKQYPGDYLKVYVGNPPTIAMHFKASADDTAQPLMGRCSCHDDIDLTPGVSIPAAGPCHDSSDRVF